MQPKELQVLYNGLKDNGIKFSVFFDKSKDNIFMLVQESFNYWILFNINKKIKNKVNISKIFYEKGRLFLEINEDSKVFINIDKEFLKEIISEYSTKKDIYLISKFLNRTVFDVILMIISGLNYTIENDTIFIELEDIYNFIDIKTEEKSFRKEFTWEQLIKK